MKADYLFHEVKDVTVRSLASLRNFRCQSLIRNCDQQKFSNLASVNHDIIVLSMFDFLLLFHGLHLPVREERRTTYELSYAIGYTLRIQISNILIYLRVRVVRVGTWQWNWTQSS